MKYQHIIYTPKPRNVPIPIISNIDVNPAQTGKHHFDIMWHGVQSPVRDVKFFGGIGAIMVTIYKGLNINIFKHNIYTN